MTQRMVWVELASSIPIRIFKSQKAARASGCWICEMPYKDAMASIRHTIWLRCKGECEDCAAPVTEASAHMHERQWRGKGGEISVENSVFICEKCHKHAHRARNPRWKKGLDKTG